MSILGLQLHYIGLSGPQYGQFVFSQISYWDRTKGLFQIATSPASGLQHWRKTIGNKMFRDRMTIPETIIDHSLPQIKAIFQVLATSSSYPVLILNRYGTDFVSMIVDLVLLLLQADTQSMHRDYMQSYEDLASSREERLEVNRAQGVPDDYVDPYLPFVSCLERHIQTKHGGIEKYLLGIGLSSSELQAVKETLSNTSSLSEKQGWLVDV
jgi:protein-tyrosine phosphatase